MALVHRVLLLLLATSSTLISKLNGQVPNGQVSIGRQIRSPLPLPSNQVTSASKGDLWQSFEVGAMDPELTDPSTVKPTLDPETLIDWYFHAADIKTKMDRESNNMAPRYVQARQGESAVMNFDSGYPQQESNDRPGPPSLNFGSFDQPRSGPQSSGEPESMSNFQNFQPATADSRPPERPVLTDYGARRTNDASIWYLRQFQSQQPNSESTYRETQQPSQPSMRYSQQLDTYNGNPYNNHLSRPMTRESSDDLYNNNNNNNYNYNNNNNNNNNNGYPGGYTGGYNSNNNNERSDSSRWRSDEFNSAFNSVIAGGDPEANDSMRQMKRSDQLRQSPVASDAGYMRGVKFDDQPSDVAPVSPVTPSPTSVTSTSPGARVSQEQSAMGQSGPSLYSPPNDSMRHVQHQGRPLMPILYEPLGFPPRFYRMQL